MHSPATTSFSLSDKQLQAKIAELQAKKHLPEQMTALAAEVTRLQQACLPDIRFTGGPESLGPEIMNKIAPAADRQAGRPLLPGREFPLDLPRIETLAREILAVLPRTVPGLAADAAELAARLAGPGVFEAACGEILDPARKEEDLPHLGGWAKTHPDAPRLFRFVVTSAALPSLTVAGRLLGREHDAETVWPHGHCPVCGNLPLIGRLVDKEGKRVHDCSFCGFAYRVPRLGCPFCLDPETEGAHYHVSDEEPGYLLTVCKPCGCYFKLGDFREYSRPWFPLLDDLASLALDIYAMQTGYKRPTLSGWGF